MQTPPAWKQPCVSARVSACVPAICRKRHADVVEWAWFVNSYGDDGVYGQLMNGDKDSFLLAFALANKTGEYYQVRLHSAIPTCHPKRKKRLDVARQSGPLAKKQPRIATHVPYGYKAGSAPQQQSCTST